MTRSSRSQRAAPERFVGIKVALALALGLWCTGVDAQPRSAPSPGAVSVDVGRLKALGLGPTADLIQAAVAQELAGGLPSAPGSRIVVRLTGLSMGTYTGAESGGGGGDGMGGAGGGGKYDYLEGDLLVLGPRGEVLTQRHQVASSPASAGGAYYLPGAEERRAQAVARNFADWLRRM